MQSAKNHNFALTCSARTKRHSHKYDSFCGFCPMKTAVGSRSCTGKSPSIRAEQKTFQKWTIDRRDSILKFDCGNIVRHGGFPMLGSEELVQT